MFCKERGKDYCTLMKFKNPLDPFFQIAPCFLLTSVGVSYILPTSKGETKVLIFCNYVHPKISRTSL